MQVHLAQFEGPLDLLLYLIRKDEMDIYDIPIHRITLQYLEYLKNLKNINLDSAGEFVAMAASLIQIKARMLLPSYDEEGEVIEEDPRKPLVQRLLEYQKYQEAGKQLYDRPILNRDVFKRGKKEDFEELEGDLLLEENALFSLISCYRLVVKRAEKATHKVSGKMQSIAARIMAMAKKLIPGQKVGLRSLIEAESENPMRQLVITFISSLELAKMGLLRLFQEEEKELQLEAIQEIREDLLTKVDEYETNLDVIELAEEAEILSEEQPQQLMLATDEIPTIENFSTDDSFEDAASDEEIEKAERDLEL